MTYTVLHSSLSSSARRERHPPSATVIGGRVASDLRLASVTQLGQRKVGDYYGKINRETSEVVWEGNVYSKHFQDRLNVSSLPLEADMNDPQLQPVTIAEAGQEFIVCSNEGFENLKVDDTGPQCARKEILPVIQDLTSVKLRVNLKFNQKIGAGSAIYKPQSPSFPKDERITDLLKTRSDILKGKYLVTEQVFILAQRLSANTEGERISASLSASVPIPGITFQWGSLDELRLRIRSTAFGVLEATPRPSSVPCTRSDNLHAASGSACPVVAISQQAISGGLRIQVVEVSCQRQNHISLKRFTAFEEEELDWD
ncbi:hypothetical protein BU15DRAFT_67910 [Melanogaster broomeanus]|nr:hypothetical protein BU15DRAFT_67910 [Melanogaster broomeanus]